MLTTLTRSVRFIFVSFLLTLTVYTLAESALGMRGAEAMAAQEGLSACGSEDTPCVLEAVTVTAEAGEGHLVSAQQASRMTMRVKS